MAAGLPFAEMNIYFFSLPLVGLKRNLSLLEIYFSRGLSQMEAKCMQDLFPLFPSGLLPFFPFLGKGSPLNSTSNKRLPFSFPMATGHLRISVDRVLSNNERRY